MTVDAGSGYISTVQMTRFSDVLRLRPWSCIENRHHCHTLEVSRSVFFFGGWWGGGGEKKKHPDPVGGFADMFFFLHFQRVESWRVVFEFTIFLD